MKKLILIILTALTLAVTAHAQEARYLFKAGCDHNATDCDMRDVVVTVAEAETGKVLAVMPWPALEAKGFNSDPRHLALDVTAAVGSGHGQKIKFVNPGLDVVTEEERADNGKPVNVTQENVAFFAIRSDAVMQGYNRYYAVVDMFLSIESLRRNWPGTKSGNSKREY
jgi:hypothetical protein